MDTLPPPSDRIETDEQRRARLAEEQRLLHAAEERAKRIGTIPATEAHAYLDSLGTANPLLRPKPRHG